MTAQEIVTKALVAIGIVQPGEGPSPEESSDGFTSLNNMISNWNELIRRTLAGAYAAELYTFTPISTFGTLGSNSTHPQAWQRAFVYNLALEIATEYGVDIPVTIAQSALGSRSAIFALPAAPAGA